MSRGSHYRDSMRMSSRHSFVQLVSDKVNATKTTQHLAAIAFEQANEFWAVADQKKRE